MKITLWNVYVLLFSVSCVLIGLLFFLSMICNFKGEKDKAVDFCESDEEFCLESDSDEEASATSG